MFENPEAVFGGTKPLLSLIESIYATMDDPSLWTPVLADIVRALQGESMAFFAVFPDSREPGYLGLHEMSREDWDRYASYYDSVNPIMPRCKLALTSGATAFSHHVVPDAELERTEFYNDFFKPGQMHYSVGLRVGGGGTVFANFSCQRPKSRGPFGEQADIVYQTLKPHLQRAISLTNKLGSLEVIRSGLEAALDHFDHAVFGLDRHGRVVLSNRKAEEIALKGDGLRLLNGFLTASCSQQDKSLGRILSAAVAAGSGNGLSSGGSLNLRRKFGSRELRLTAVPFVSPLAGCSSQLAALIFVSDLGHRVQSRAEVMRALFALTPTETRVADLLLEGLDVREVGYRLGLTAETTRFHVKRILAKTGTRRQAELLKLMLSLPAADIRPEQ